MIELAGKRKKNWDEFVVILQGKKERIGWEKRDTNAKKRDRVRQDLLKETK